MKKENCSSVSLDARLTRARAAACRANSGLPPLPSSVANPERKQTCSKRRAHDINSHIAPCPVGSQCKKRAVLKDATNTSSQNTSRKWIPSGKVQPSVQRQRRAPLKTKGCVDSKASNLSLDGNEPINDNVENLLNEETQKMEMLVSKEPSLLERMDSFESDNKGMPLVGNAFTDDNEENEMFEEEHKMKISETKNSSSLGNVEDSIVVFKDMDTTKDRESTCATSLVRAHNFEGNLEFTKQTKNGKFSVLGFIDIDTDHGNPQMCCTYASEIYTTQCVTELVRRPVANYMESLQRDVSQSMRAILIDWLVEVSEEYKLVPDTLYLTVHIIDEFLSHNYIERQRLQLLGITCMLIASKYEEICPPRVEEFCFITDNTYTKAEVLEMERQVLSFLGFKLSLPTTKTFLRRFLQAANASHENQTLTFGYLTNYLAEMTLVEYSFLKFLPSIIAASAVFLARWTLESNHTNHPWNSTLEHYTCYKATDLKEAVLALRELQMNSKNSPLDAIREKYSQPKFDSVAILTSRSIEESLFS
ncbi:cyclin-A2-1-like [Zingiber officinale]|nr:cyclin-A2-1-like [Zingiber officinale]